MLSLVSTVETDVTPANLTTNSLEAHGGQWAGLCWDRLVGGAESKLSLCQDEVVELLLYLRETAWLGVTTTGHMTRLWKQVEAPHWTHCLQQHPAQKSS